MNASANGLALRFAIVAFSTGGAALWACSWAGWRAVRKRGFGLMRAGLSGFGMGLLLLVALSLIAQFMLAAEAEEGFSPYPGIGMFVAGLLLTPGAFVLGLLGGVAARRGANSKTQ